MDKEEFIDSTTAYIKTHPHYESWSKEAAVRATLQLLVDDIGAAQGFLNAIDVKVDLYG